MGVYLRYTNSIRPTKTRKARPLSARMRREPRVRYRRGHNVRREERNTCNAVKSRHIQGLKRSAEGAGSWAVRRKTRDKARNTATSTSESAALDIKS